MFLLIPFNMWIIRNTNTELVHFFLLLFLYLRLIYNISKMLELSFVF
jgi:hypothetical protein